MKYIEAPQEYAGNEPSIFLAGGISGCPDWQVEMVAKLSNTPLVLFNPRRKDFKFHQEETRRQIKWEYHQLRKANAILFWFPHETLCPIVLYELGAWSMTDKKIFVGVSPWYERINDVIIQTELARPDVKVVFSLKELAEQVIEWSKP